MLLLDRLYSTDGLYELHFHELRVGPNSYQYDNMIYKWYHIIIGFKF